MNEKVYAVKAIDTNIVGQSSSGGAYTLISDIVLDDGGAICCAIYEYPKKEMEFHLISSKEERNLSRGSKYIYSNPGDAFREISAWVTAHPGKRLLFIGTGCQADGLRKYAEHKNIRDSIMIVDIVCHGLPSKLIWRDYISRYQNVRKINFRDKRNGWECPTAYLIGKRPVSMLPYTRLYYSCCAMRPSCYECPYATVERKTDLTIGDYWGIKDYYPDFFSSNGVSLVICHSEQGQSMIEKIQKESYCIETKLESCLQPNLVRPTERPSTRDSFWNDYNNHGFDHILRNYANYSATYRIKELIKSFIGKV